MNASTCAADELGVIRYLCNKIVALNAQPFLLFLITAYILPGPRVSNGWK